ncbi:MAG: M28 family peptidase [Pyrinomonadaceae bacterium]
MAIFGATFAQTLPKSKLIDAGKLVDDLKVLSADDMEGRAPETEGSAKARAFIIKRFQESGITPFTDNYEQTYRSGLPSKPNELHTGVNVVGYVDGSSGSKKYIVVSAHYDHLGIRDGKIYNGADDNASGTASLFSIAKYFKDHRPENPVIFVAFDSEETNGAGGREFLAHPPVLSSEIILNVNVDMIGRDANNILYAVGTYHFPYLKPYLEKAAANTQVKLLFGHDVPDTKIEDWTRDSDHYSFHRVGIPWIYFGVEDFEQHHKSTDDFETMTLPFYIHAVEAVILSIKQFDANLAAIEKQRKPV